MIERVFKNSVGQIDETYLAGCILIHFFRVRNSGLQSEFDNANSDYEWVKAFVKSVFLLLYEMLNYVGKLFISEDVSYPGQLLAGPYWTLYTHPHRLNYLKSSFDFAHVSMKSTKSVTFVEITIDAGIFWVFKKNRRS